MRTLSLIVIGSMFHAAAASADGGFGPGQQAEVEDLVVCYARATDLLGRAVDAVPTGDNLESTVNADNEVFAEALALYRSCFSRDFSFSLQFDGVTAVTVPDPATRTPTTRAALQWANFVNNDFRAAGYESTQHHMGSISSELRGKEAQVVSYLIATHVFGPDGDETEGSVSVVGGTYTDRVVRDNGRWVIARRTLNITSNVMTSAP